MMAGTGQIAPLRKVPGQSHTYNPDVTEGCAGRVVLTTERRYTLRRSDKARPASRPGQGYGRIRRFGEGFRVG